MEGTLTEAEAKDAGIVALVVLESGGWYYPFVRIDRKGKWHGIRTIQDNPRLVAYGDFGKLMHKLRGKVARGR